MWRNYYQASATAEITETILKRFIMNSKIRKIIWTDSMEYSLDFDNLINEPTFDINIRVLYILKQNPSEHLVKIYLEIAGSLSFEASSLRTTQSLIRTFTLTYTEV